MAKSKGLLQGLDPMKFLMAACVVLIHVKSFYRDWNSGAAVDYIISLAVPFFFIASGYLLAHKIRRRGDDNGVLKPYSRRIWRMYFLWIAIYIPLAVFGHCVNPTEPTFLKFALVQVKTVFFVGEVRYSFPTWYLFSLGFATIFAAFFSKRKINPAYLFVIGLFGMAMQYGYQRLGMTGPADFAMRSLSRITIGSGYVVAGMWIYRLRRPVNMLIATGAFFVSLLLYDFGLPFWELAGSFALFAVTLRLPLRLSETAALWFRNQSLWIYLTHMYVLTPLYFLSDIKSAVTYYATALIVCILLSQALIAASKTRGGSFLKQLV